MDKDIDVHIFRAPVSEWNNTPGRSLPIREWSWNTPYVKIHEIVLCVGTQRGGFWVTAAHGSLQRCSHDLENLNYTLSVSAVLCIKQGRMSLRIGAGPTFRLTSIIRTLALCLLYYNTLLQHHAPLKSGFKCILSCNFAINVCFFTNVKD